MNKSKTLTGKQYEDILRRYIYGEPLVRLAKEYGTCSYTLNKMMEKCYGRVTDYKHDSLIVYLQHSDHNVKSAAKRFHMSTTSIHTVLRTRFGCNTLTSSRTYYKHVPLDELRKMKAPYEQYVISYLEEEQRNAQPTCSLFEGLTKDERIAKARDMNLRVKQNVAAARRRRKLEQESAHIHKDTFYSKLLA